MIEHIRSILANYGITCEEVTESGGSYIVKTQVIQFNSENDHIIKNEFAEDLEIATGTQVSVGDEEYAANANNEQDPDYYDTFTIKPC